VSGAIGRPATDDSTRAESLRHTAGCCHCCHVHLDASEDGFTGQTWLTDLYLDTYARYAACDAGADAADTGP
jgi:hypothetical protein